jgi:aspartyl-tRNA(Asn)/glutamyl-tRNA(Gln) amidotransferase subunit C
MVTQEDVKKVARLADVGIEDGELDEFTTQCTRILTYFAELDTLSQEPLHREQFNNLRDDVIEPSFDQEEALQNAPERENGFFKAPRVM